MFLSVFCLFNDFVSSKWGATHLKTLKTPFLGKNELFPQELCTKKAYRGLDTQGTAP